MPVLIRATDTLVLSERVSALGPSIAAGGLGGRQAQALCVAGHGLTQNRRLYNYELTIHPANL